MNEKIKKTYNLFFVVAFFITLLIPIVRFNGSLKTVNDNFYGKTQLVQAVTNFRILLGDQVYNNAVTGKSGWLIFTGDLSSDDYQNIIPLSENKLEQFQKNLDSLAIRYKERGITLLVVIAPNKNTIYPEYVPDEIPVLNEESRLDQLLHYMDKYGNTKILDLRPSLVVAKKNSFVYYRTDTHWNSYGAFVAYQQIVSALSVSYPEMQPLGMSNYTINAIHNRRLDLSNMINTSLIMEDIIRLEPNFESEVLLRSVPIRANIQRDMNFSSNLEHPEYPTAIIFHDSFAESIMPFLQEHFSQAIFVPHATPVFDLGWVDEQKPDIVIIEFTERYIEDLIILVNTAQ